MEGASSTISRLRVETEDCFLAPEACGSALRWHVHSSSAALQRQQMPTGSVSRFRVHSRRCRRGSRGVVDSHPCDTAEVVPRHRVGHIAEPPITLGRKRACAIPESGRNTMKVVSKHFMPWRTDYIASPPFFRCCCYLEAKPR